MRLFHSKHQKLILQCYPPGKAVDKKPNPSELSYLLYYASTRRIKLEKVIEYIKAKTTADVRSRKSGNLLVTLSIIQALTQKCYDNLNVFAPQVCTILAAILSLKELPLCKAVVATYGTFCSKLDNGLFAGDKRFVQSFSKLTQDLIDLGQTQSSMSSTNPREWKMVSLLTCRHVSNCLGHNAQLSKKFVPVSVALLTPTIATSYDSERLSSRLRASLNLESRNERALSTTTTVRSAAARDQAAQNFEDDTLTDSDLAEESFLGIQSLFHTTLASQISQATRSVVEHEFKRKSADQEAMSWGTIFLEMCASYIPVQLRFVTLMTLLDVLSTLSNNFEKDAYPLIKHYSMYILDLVSSGFNIIGLSISDVLLQLLALHTSLHLKLADTLTPVETAELSDIYSKCICNLSSHIYYFDQVSDSIEGINFQIDSVLMVCREQDCDKVHTLVLQLLDMIATIINLVSESTSARNRASLESWEVSFQLLTFKETYSSFSSYATSAQVVGLQRKFLEVFQHFLNTEMMPQRKLAKGSGVNATMVSFTAPNYANYLDENDNPITRLLKQVELYFEDGMFEMDNAKSLCYVLETISQIFGINFGKNFLLFFDKWQLKEPTTDLAQLLRDKAAYRLLSGTITIINQEYQDILEEDITKSPLYIAIQKDIDLRTSSGFWAAEETSTANYEAMFSKQVTSQEIGSYFDGTQFTQWFHHRGQKNEAANGGDETDGGSAQEDSASRNAQNGFGLGTANDISSIYSGLLNGNGTGRTEPTGDTSRITNDTIPTYASSAFGESHSYAYHMVPRVEDLKLSVKGALSARGDQFSFHHESSDAPKASILQKQIHTTDVNSILADLKIEDDKEIVV